MFQRKAAEVPTRRVWRMSATNPAGEFVEASKPRTRNADPGEVHDGGFRSSSFDLARGSDVAEADWNTLPGELAELFTEPGR